MKKTRIILSVANVCLWAVIMIIQILYDFSYSKEVLIIPMFILIVINIAILILLIKNQSSNNKNY